MAEPFIKLYKKMLKWEWYDDPNTKILFIHCLLRANWQEAKWHGVTLKPGQFITSLESLAKETKLTINQVRTALEHLKTTGEITSSSQARYRIITVVKWNEYQADHKLSHRQTTDKPQADHKLTTTDKEYKEIKNKKNIYKAPEPAATKKAMGGMERKYSSEFFAELEQEILGSEGI